LDVYQLAEELSDELKGFAPIGMMAPVKYEEVSRGKNTGFWEIGIRFIDPAVSGIDKGVY
jgi:hypothetical protein